MSASTARFLVVFVVVIAAAFGVRSYVAAPYYVPSQSMEPTLHGCPGCNDDHVLVDKLAYHLHDPHRGDVIVFSRPSTWHVPDSTLIKRVIALPGDRLTLRSGKLYINGRLLTEPYVNPLCPPISSLSETDQVASTGVIPAGQYFVMGDNRCDSEDSRMFGTVPRADIVGRAFIIVWPLSRLHYL